MKIYNIVKKQYFLTSRKIAKPTALSIGILIIISLLSISAAKGALAPTTPTLTNNAVWIQDNPAWLGFSPLDNTHMQETVNNLIANGIKNTFVSVTKVTSQGSVGWNVKGTEDLSYQETSTTYHDFVSLCNAQGINVYAWLENNQPLNLTPSNWGSLESVYASVLAYTGMNGINSDIEQLYNSRVGTQQNYIDFNNNMTVYMHTMGKLWTLDQVYFDTPIDQIGNLLHVDYEVIMFYSSHSTFEDAQAIAFWNEQFNPVPISPIILGIYCGYANANDDAWQFQQIANMINNYGTNNADLVGVCLWNYEYIYQHQSFASFDNLINQFGSNSQTNLQNIATLNPSSSSTSILSPKATATHTPTSNPTPNPTSTPKVTPVPTKTSTNTPTPTPKPILSRTVTYTPPKYSYRR